MARGTMTEAYDIVRNKRERIEIGDSEAQLIAFDLRIAAEQYERDAAELVDAAHARMREQFEWQAKRSRALADLLGQV